MKVIVDENVSYSVVKRLRLQGWDIIAIADDKNRAWQDDNIYHLALQEKAIIITRDYHFTNPVRFPIMPEISIVYIRHGNLTSEQETDILDMFFHSVKLDEIRGKLVTLYYNTETIR